MKKEVRGELKRWWRRGSNEESYKIKKDYKDLWKRKKGEKMRSG